jgi:hypothetical protein
VTSVIGNNRNSTPDSFIFLNAFPPNFLAANPEISGRKEDAKAKALQAKFPGLMTNFGVGNASREWEIRLMKRAATGKNLELKK